MPNFGLPLLLNWRPLRKTSYLKITGLCRTVIYNLQKRSWTNAKTGQLWRQSGAYPTTASQGNNHRDTPRGTG